MRSSKSRSRSKSNRPRSIGNIVNRVFDSSGPEGKVRGTPQQIIEKYLFLARDAQLSNDRVAAENFLQHAEHYTRMLGEAQRELAAEQDARRGQPDGNMSGDAQGNGGQNGNQNGGNQPESRQPEPRQTENRQNENRPNRDRQRRDDRGDDRNEPRQDSRGDDRPDQSARHSATEVIDLSGDADTGLVETPESRPAAQPEPRPQVVHQEPAQAADAGADEKPARAPRRPRGPRKPRATDGDAKGDSAPGGDEGGTPQASAAE